MTKRPFRFGLVAYEGSTDFAEWRDLARRAESNGYSTLSIGDHFALFLPLGGAAPLLALADAASATETLRVGTAMLANDYRHPAVVAKEAATLDVLSGGRLEFGVGTGWLREDYDLVGMQFDPAPTRVDRLAEAVSVIRSCWSGESFSFEGEHYRIRDYVGLPRPRQHPHPPVLIGGGSSRVLSVAGRLADIVGIHVSTAVADASGRAADTRESRVLQKVEWVRRAAGARFDELELQMALFTVVVSADLDAAVRSEAARTGSDVDTLLGSVMTLAGTVDDVCDELRRRRESWGVSYFTVPATCCELFAPVVARLAGT